MDFTQQKLLNKEQVHPFFMSLFIIIISFMSYFEPLCNT